jgi:hypothetical protein
MRARSSSAPTPVTRIILLPLVWPEAMLTEEGGTCKSFCEKIDAGVIRFAVHWRSRERKLQRIADFARNGIVLRARTELHRESYAATRLLNGYQAVFLSENTVSLSRRIPAKDT